MKVGKWAKNGEMVQNSQPLSPHLWSQQTRCRRGDLLDQDCRLRWLPTVPTLSHPHRPQAWSPHLQFPLLFQKCPPACPPQQQRPRWRSHQPSQLHFGRPYHALPLTRKAVRSVIFNQEDNEERAWLHREELAASQTRYHLFH